MEKFIFSCEKNIKFNWISVLKTNNWLHMYHNVHLCMMPCLSVLMLTTSTAGNFETQMGKHLPQGVSTLWLQIKKGCLLVSHSFPWCSALQWFILFDASSLGIQAKIYNNLWGKQTLFCILTNTIWQVSLIPLTNHIQDLIEILPFLHFAIVRTLDTSDYI